MFGKRRWWKYLVGRCTIVLIPDHLSAWGMITDGLTQVALPKSKSELETVALESALVACQVEHMWHCRQVMCRGAQLARETHCPRESGTWPLTLPEFGSLDVHCGETQGQGLCPSDTKVCLQSPCFLEKMQVCNREELIYLHRFNILRIRILLRYDSWCCRSISKMMDILSASRCHLEFCNIPRSIFHDRSWEWKLRISLLSRGDPGCQPRERALSSWKLTILGWANKKQINQALKRMITYCDGAIEQTTGSFE